MGEEKKYLGKLDERGILPQIQRSFNDQWCGVIRLRSGGCNGSIWFVNGHVVHSAVTGGERDLEGQKAFECVLEWKGGVFFRERDLLPPSRTIRVSTVELLASSGCFYGKLLHRESTKKATDRTGEHLNRIFERLRQKIPGLESISVMKGNRFEASTSEDEMSRSRIQKQISGYLASGANSPRRLYLQEGNTAILVERRGERAAVLSANGSTAPEVMFWAADEALRGMPTNLTGLYRQGM